MKKLLNRMKVAFTIISCLGITLFFTGCKDDDDTPPDCGCESETQTIIPESANLIGRLSFKANDSVDPYYTNHYWITYLDQNCSNCVHHMIICNEEMLGNQFDDVDNLQKGEFVDIKFSGYLKEICQKRFDLADITYNRITLTSIERL